MSGADLVSVATAWCALDPDPTTVAQTKAMIERADLEELHEHFGAMLNFGTAGMRGALGPGPNRMNQLLVRQVTTALGAYLLETVEGAATRGVVIGRDGRYGSVAFEAEAVGVLKAQGFVVHRWSDVVPTPELAHAVTHLGCVAGIMVTASHNPPTDNGYKVYWANGAQFIPPHDHAVFSRIEKTPPVVLSDEPAHLVPSEVRMTYLRSVAALRVTPVNGARVVYSAMHGVGAERVAQALSMAGHNDTHFVAEQRQPDPDFPTVAFPNPEEPGALKLSVALAQKVDADVILANDPDADRLAVALPSEQGWQKLTGNQIGVVLAASRLRALSHLPDPMVATTVVSSMMLSKMAAEYGVRFVSTLTGFKWIANQAIAHKANGGTFLMGYEEALGYTVGDVVRDKDGVSAVLLFADLVSALKAEGRTVWDELTDLYERFGLHRSGQKSVVFPGATGKATMTSMMERARQAVPAEIAGISVDQHFDLLNGTAVGADPIDVPTSDVLVFMLADGSRIILRPSGTEPKIKLYLEVVESYSGDKVAAAERAEGRYEALMDAATTALLG